MGHIHRIEILDDQRPPPVYGARIAIPIEPTGSVKNLSPIRGSVLKRRDSSFWQSRRLIPDHPECRPPVFDTARPNPIIHVGSHCYNYLKPKPLSVPYPSRSHRTSFLSPPRNEDLRTSYSGPSQVHRATPA